MAKFYGKIGFVNTVEERAGIWKEQVYEKTYAGELNRNTMRINNRDEVNNSINLSNSISILADAYAIDNIFAMRYIEFASTKWKITDVEVNFPRLNITIGGLYNA